MEVKQFKVAEGTEKIDAIIAEDVQEFELYLPSSIKELSILCVKCDANSVVRVYYDGTISDWKQIKKGSLDKCEIKDDWYGSYYHNTPSSTTYREFYYN
ncbi:MAG: hypothetical protein ACI4MQ_06885 [Candidatus Coproplasma sp.]